MALIPNRPLKFAALGAVCAVLAACSGTLPPEAPAPEVPLSHSVEQANRTLELAHAERAAIERSYAAAEAACASRFFVTSCLEAAREKRRAALVPVRATEIEAEYFKRKHAADERDRALADAQRADEERAAARAAEAAAEAAAAAAAPPPAPEAAPPKPGLTAQQRSAANAAKLKAIAERERAGAGERAANVAEYAAKQREFERRQRRVAEKKAKRAAER